MPAQERRTGGGQSTAAAGKVCPCKRQESSFSVECGMNGDRRIPVALQPRGIRVASLRTRPMPCQCKAQCHQSQVCLWEALRTGAGVSEARRGSKWVSVARFVSRLEGQARRCDQDAEQAVGADTNGQVQSRKGARKSLPVGSRAACCRGRDARTPATETVSTMRSSPVHGVSNIVRRGRQP